MKEEKDNLVLKSYRLTSGQIEFIDALVAKRIFGTSANEVVRTLLSFAIKDLTQSEYVRKELEQRKLLRR